MPYWRGLGAAGCVTPWVSFQGALSPMCHLPGRNKHSGSAREAFRAGVKAGMYRNLTSQ